MREEGREGRSEGGREGRNVHNPSQCCIQKMWLGGQTEFPKCRGAKVYTMY